MQFEELVEKIKDLMVHKSPLIIAVSGFGGAGKSTLAKSLHKHFDNSNLVQLDSFLINHGEGDGWKGGYDWERFERLLKEIEAGKNLHYQWYNWDKNETEDWTDEALVPLVIVEGVRMFYPEIIKYFDFTIWIDVSLEVAVQQGKARDARNKSEESPEKVAQHLAKWDEVWTPKEEEFLRLFNPSDKANVRY